MLHNATTHALDQADSELSMWCTSCILPWATNAAFHTGSKGCALIMPNWTAKAVMVVFAVLLQAIWGFLTADWGIADWLQRQEFAQPAQFGHGAAQSLLPPSKHFGFCVLLAVLLLNTLFQQSAVIPIW